MVENKSRVKKLTEFDKIVDDLENIEEKVKVGDKTLLLLHSLPRPFENFKISPLYDKEDTITLDVV